MNTDGVVPKLERMAPLEPSTKEDMGCGVQGEHGAQR